MAGKKKKRQLKPEHSSKRFEPSFILIACVVAIIFLLGFIVKAAFFPGNQQTNVVRTYPSSSQLDESLEAMVQLVVSEFRCACGGCGELPLLDCNCDMPRGALEEKRYIRSKLQEGVPVDRVIQMVEGLYGHRMSG